MSQKNCIRFLFCQGQLVFKLAKDKHFVELWTSPNRMEFLLDDERIIDESSDLKQFL